MRRLLLKLHCLLEIPGRLSIDECNIRKYIGCQFVILVLKFPVIHMYWERKTIVSQIADSISRSLFIFESCICYNLLLQLKEMIKFEKLGPLQNILGENVRNCHA